MHPRQGLPEKGLPDFWGRLVSGSGCRQERPGASSVGTAEPGRPDNGTAGIPPPINRLPWGHGHQGAAQVSAPRWQKSGGQLGANLPSRWTFLVTNLSIGWHWSRTRSTFRQKLGIGSNRLSCLNQKWIDRTYLCWALEKILKSIFF